MKNLYRKFRSLVLMVSFCYVSITNSSSFSLDDGFNSIARDQMHSFKELAFFTEKAKVVDFTLINADKNKDLFEIRDGDKINLNDIGTRHINIRANINPTKTGSVSFKLTGQVSYERVENISPYALYANDKNNYFKWTPQPGNYAITAIPFTEEKGMGQAGEPHTISFQIMDDMIITGFVLVNADNDKDIFEIKDGMEVDLKKLPSQNINIRANTAPEIVGSVELSITELSDDNFYSHIENAIPYAFFSDHKGDYYGRIAENGDYVLKAIPYKSNHVRGRQGSSLQIAFKMINGSNMSTARFMESDIVLESFRVFPNPGRNTLNIFLNNPNNQKVVIQIFDLMGNEVMNKIKTIENINTNMMMDVSGLGNNHYVIKLSSEKDVTSMRWIKE